MAAGCVRGSALLHVRATIAEACSDRAQQELVEAVLAELQENRAALTKAQRKEAVARPLAEHGEAALLDRIRVRLDRAGYPWPAVEVAWRDVSVTRQAVSAGESIPSLLDLLHPLWHLLRRRQQTGLVTALHTCSGVLRPGTLTLLLGPPGSGRSTLLQLLAGRLSSSRVVTVDGRSRVTYNGLPFGRFVVAKTATYVDQVDCLLPTLTCRETLNFSEVCNGFSGQLTVALVALKAWEAAHPEAATRVPLDDEADKALEALVQPGSLTVTEWCLSTLGLQHCGDTLVGDAMLRGVSGGEKRRVTVGEGLVGPAMVLLLDEASSGLDSASTLALITSMGAWARLLNTTVVMALQQPEPAVLQQFDDVLLLSQGHTLWHGPTAAALQHFEGACGLCPQPGQSVLDFLQQVAGAGGAQQQQPEHSQMSSDDNRAALDAASLAEEAGPAQLSALFWASPQGKAMQAAALAAGQGPECDGAALGSLYLPHMRPPWHVLLAACTKRLLTIELARNWEACAMRWLLAGFMALVTGLLFLQLPVSFEGGISLMGMLFQGLFFIQILGLPTLELTFEKRPILFRQRDADQFPAWVEWLPSVLLNVPVVLVDSLVYGGITYFLIGFTPSAPAFFTFLLVLVCLGCVCDTLYRAYGSAAQVLSFALGVGICQALANEMLAGFVITPNAIPAYWAWAYWVNPLAYAFRALAINEFSQARWQQPVAGSSDTLGASILGFFQVQQRTNASSWVWGGVGVLAGMWALAGAVALLAYTFNKLPESFAVLKEAEPVLAGAAPGAVSKQSQGAGGGEGQGKGADELVIELPLTPTGAAAHKQEAAARPSVSIAFRDVSYFVRHPAPPPGSGTRELQLLHGITGTFRPGVLTALMGASGAAKTTLLDVLAGRKSTGRVSGDICVSVSGLGGLPRPTHFSRLIGYCEQADIHVPLTTVREALEFSAALRLQTPGATNARSRAALVAAAVDRTLAAVDLTSISGRLVGKPGVSGLSTEARKRLTIAVELVTAPRVLFLDEPTSSLDSRGAELIARLMADVSHKQGVAVVSTIHQPSAAIMDLFDELLLLQRGRLVFGGPLGPGCASLLHHLQAAVPNTPAFTPGVTNPASWMLEVVNGPSSTRPDAPNLAALYAASTQAQAVAKQVEQLCAPPPDTQAAAALQQLLQPPAAAGSAEQLRALLRRNFGSHARAPGATLGRFVVTVAISLIVGSIELGKGNTSKIHDAHSTHNCLGALYMLATALAVEVAFECQPALIAERVVFYREKAAGCYGAGAYLAAQALVEAVYITAQVAIFVLTTFFMLHLDLSAALFFYVAALVWCSCMVGFLTAQALVHVTPAAYLATTLLSVLSVLQSLVSGYSRPLPLTPKAWWPAFFLNPAFYSFMGIGSSVLGSVATPIANPAAPGQVLPVAAYVEQLYGMGAGRFPGAGGSLGMLLVAGGAMLAVSFAGLRCCSFQRR